MSELKWDYSEGEWSAFSELVDEFGSPSVWAIKITEEGWFQVNGSDVDPNWTELMRGNYSRLIRAKMFAQSVENELVSDLATKERAEAKHGKEWCDE